MADLSTFLTIFPEFEGQTSTLMNFYLQLGLGKFSVSLLGGQYDYAIYLFMAHNLTLKAGDQRDVSNGGLPGGTLGPVASKSAGPVSVSYDTGSVTTPGMGAYNATSYGQLLATLLSEAAVGQVLTVGIPTRRHSLFGPYGFLNRPT